MYNLFALENFKILRKNSQNRQIEKTLMVSKNQTKHFLQKLKSVFSISYNGLSK
jgi:hypothetical protein